MSWSLSHSDWLKLEAQWNTGTEKLKRFLMMSSVCITRLREQLDECYIHTHTHTHTNTHTHTHTHTYTCGVRLAYVPVCEREREFVCIRGLLFSHCEVTVRQTAM